MGSKQKKKRKVTKSLLHSLFVPRTSAGGGLHLCVNTYACAAIVAADDVPQGTSAGSSIG